MFVAKTDNYDCTYKHNMLPGRGTHHLRIENRTSIVNFSVNKDINAKDYGVASLITLGSIGGFYLVAIIMIFIFTRWGTVSSFVRNRSKDAVDHADDEEVEEEVVADPVITIEERKKLLTQKQLTVDLLARAPKKDRRRAYNYLWHILSIAIFYSIPVVQLVSTYQRVVNRTGDQDMCYYNFLCAHPAWGLSDFNHIFSNVGYVFMGILFLGAVLYRHSCIPSSEVSTIIRFVEIDN